MADQPEPPQGLTPGATDRGDGNVTFALFAPHKQSVHLLGDFNDFDAQADPMHVTEAGLWWIEKQLDKGTHRYQFLVDGQIRIADPYAQDLQSGDDADEDPHALVHVGRISFPWKHDHFVRPHYEDLVIYEIHVGDFTKDGTFRAAAEKLDYLQDLGINAIQLLPVFGSPNRDYWGYEPTYIFSVKRKYGSPEDLKYLIDQAHARDIAVILDVVLAHTSGDHPYVQLYDIEDSPWYSEKASEKNLFGFPSFDYDKQPARDFNHDFQRFWLEAYHIDGFRYDYLRLIHCQSEDGTKVLVQPGREIRADAYLIGEHLPEDPGLINRSDLNGNWHARFSRAMKALVREAEVDTFDWDDLEEVLKVLDREDQGYEQAAQMLNYVESHDEGRTVLEAREAGFEEDAARRKSAMAAAILLTAPGVPMLYHGQEWGEETERSEEANPIHWDKLDTDAGQGMLAHFRKLCRLRREHAALRSDHFERICVDNDRKMLAFHRWDDQGDDILVAVNLRGEEQSIDLTFPSPGRWFDAIADQELEVGEDPYRLNLQPYTPAVLIRQ